MCFFGEKIPAETVERVNPNARYPATSRFFNLHPSLLPEYKGVKDPVREMIKHGRVYTGVSMHEVDRHIDNGEVIGQRTYRLPKECVEDKILNWKRDELDWRTDIGYVYGAIPEMAKLCKDVLKRGVRRLVPINQYHDSLYPQKAFMTTREIF